MTKPWTERRAAATNAHCENMRPGSSVDHTDTFRNAWEIRTSFEAGADWAYAQGLADAPKRPERHECPKCGTAWESHVTQRDHSARIAELEAELEKMTALNKGHAQAYLQQADKRIEREREIEALTAKLQKAKEKVQSIISLSHSWVITKENGALLTKVHDQYREYARQALKELEGE